MVSIWVCKLCLTHLLLLRHIFRLSQNIEKVSHYFEILTHYFEILTHYFEILTHYFEILTHYFEILTHYFVILSILRKFLIIMTYRIFFFHHIGGNGLPYILLYF